jgi:poly(U)-specific endoribonuclease
MSDIYQEIWNSDKNGFSVSLRSGDSWKNPSADILLDIQVEASGKGSIDLATKPLFNRVNEEKFKLPTYVSFINLLDNYIANFRAEDILSEDEQKEIEIFLDKIVETEPMQIAYTYITEKLGVTLSKAEFRKSLRRIWFEMYTTHFKGKSTHFCSGFEHVFVGEAKFDADFRITRDRTKNLGEISGYHSWIKFYLDEKVRNVNFLGFKFDLRGNEIPNNPNVITLQMLQDLTNVRGELVAQLFKKKGGFFVGSSPECEMAIGTVTFYESLDGRLKQDKRRTTINGGIYDLVLFRNITVEGNRGEFIRSFFPIFLGNEGKPLPDNLPDSSDIPDVIVVPVDIKNDKPVAIVEALPNPAGDDEGKEWVKLQNTTDEEIDLTGWEMRDKEARPEPLSGTLQPNETKQFFISRSNSLSMQLGNKTGLISLYDRESKIVANVRYSRADSGQIIRFERTNSEE